MPSSTPLYGRVFNLPEFALNGGPEPAAFRWSANDAGYYLRTFETVMDAAYLEPLRVTPDSGYEIFRGYAATSAELSAVRARLGQGVTVVFATGGARARGDVSFYRADTSAGAVVVKAGTRVRTSTTRREYVLLTDLIFTVADTGPHVGTVEAIEVGAVYNLPAPFNRSTTEVVEGAIDTIAALSTATSSVDPTFVFDPFMRCAQAGAVTGGVDGYLDGLAEDVGTARAAGESDELLRFRIRSLPDTVSPAALRRALASVFESVRVRAELVEVGAFEFQTCWDAPLDADPLVPTYDPTTFVFDDPRYVDFPWRNRWVSSVEERGAVYAVVAPVPVIADYTGHFDAADLGAGDRLSATGFYEPFVWWERDDGAPDGTPLDGDDYALSALYVTAYDALYSARAGGVFVTLEQLGE